MTETAAASPDDHQSSFLPGSGVTAAGTLSVDPPAVAVADGAAASTSYTVALPKTTKYNPGEGDVTKSATKQQERKGKRKIIAASEDRKSINGFTKKGIGRDSSASLNNPPAALKAESARHLPEVPQSLPRKSLDERKDSQQYSDVPFRLAKVQLSGQDTDASKCSPKQGRIHPSPVSN